MNNLLYIPNGYNSNNLGGINFSTFNPIQGFYIANTPSSFGWNDFNIQGISYSQNTLLNDIGKATQSGETEKSKVLSAILVYGPTIAAMISQIILATKGKSMTNPNQLTDQEARELLLKLDGNFSPDHINQTYANDLNGGSKIMGILTNPIVLIFGVVLIFSIVKGK